MRGVLTWMTGLAAIASLAGCTPQGILEQYGFVAQLPASTAHGPGTLVAKRVENTWGKTLVLNYVCEPSSTVAGVDPDIEESGSTNIALDGSFDLSGDALAGIGLNLAAKYAKNVKLDLENTAVVSYSGETLDSILSKLPSSCRKHLRTVKNGDAYQVARVFRADLSYEVTYSAEASASAKTAVANELSAKFGLSLSGKRSQTGKGVYFGVDLVPITSGS